MTAASAPRVSEPGARHDWIDTLCTRLELVLWGQEADALLAAPDELPERGGLARLPVWLWSDPGIDIGRKARTRGGTLLMPVRVNRDQGFLTIVPDGSVAFTRWSADGLGVHRSGELDVIATPLGTDTGPICDPHLEHINPPTISRFEMRGQLRAISAAGKSARWDVLLGLEPYVRASVASAHTYVCAELAGPGRDSRPVLDHTSLQQVADTLLLGEDPDVPGRPKVSVVARLIERCLLISTFARVDPLMYIRRALRRDAEQAIRVYVGDPRLGPKIRSVQRELGSADIQEIITVYRRRHPHDELGPGRVLKALESHTLTAPCSVPDPHLIRNSRSVTELQGC